MLQRPSCAALEVPAFLGRLVEREGRARRPGWHLQAMSRSSGEAPAVQRVVKAGGAKLDLAMWRSGG